MLNRMMPVWRRDETGVYRIEEMPTEKQEVISSGLGVPGHLCYFRDAVYNLHSGRGDC